LILDLRIISQSFKATFTPLEAFLTRIGTGQLLFHARKHENVHQSHLLWIMKLVNNGGDEDQQVVTTAAESSARGGHKEEGRRARR
jgi:hypothetical protein